MGQTWKAWAELCFEARKAVRAAKLAGTVRGAWARSRRGHWQTWCGETWSGCQSKQRSTGLKGLHMAPNHAWSSSSLCFQILVSTNIVTLELEKQQKLLHCSPLPFGGLNIFPVCKGSLAELLILIRQCRYQESGGSQEEHQLAAWVLPVLHDQFKHLPNSLQT